METGQGRSSELRLALVCYGGVSLAIYMHGITKELHKLVRASRAFDLLDDLDGQNPFVAAGSGGTHDSEAVYFEALRDLAKAGRPISVSIDIISGTSAGGINGVALAKTIALDASQESLKRTWIEEGDLKKLLRAPRIGGLRLRAAMAGVRQLLTAFRPSSPLRGEQMSRLLLGALGEMDATGGTSTLIPRLGSLELFVTTTDMHGFEVLVPSGVGGASQRDRYHAQVLEFRARHGDTSGFGPGRTPALAFAARATSSFPGAFAPVSLGSFLKETGTPVAATNDLFRFQYEENGKSETDAWFVDGGVLDNAPFDLVIDGIRRRRAQSEVLRRLIYIQPDPGRALGAQPPSDPRDRSSWIGGLWQIVIGAKGTHPILLELLRLRDMNWRIAQIGAIADTQMSEVLDVIGQALRDTSPAADAAPTEDRPSLDAIGSKEQVQAVSDRMHLRAEEVLGPAWATYQRLKVDAAGRRLAEEIAKRFTQPPDSGRSSFVRAAVGAWARSRPEWSDPDPSKLKPLLGPVDVPYRERRLMFLLAGVNSLYGAPDADGPSRASLDRLKQVAWNLLDQLFAAPRKVVGDVPGEAVEFLSPTVVDSHVFDRPEDFAARYSDEFAALFDHYRDALSEALGDGSTPLWQTFEAETKEWTQKHRLALLGRYVGFPMWDGLIFPIISLSELPQFTPIAVSQFSPLAAFALPTPEGGKLKGVTLHHFAAFLSTEWRENDYLWGRLDGAELILRTLQESRLATPDTPLPEESSEGRESPVAAAGGQRLIEALRAVLATETDLARISELRARLARQIDNLAE